MDRATRALIKKRKKLKLQPNEAAKYARLCLGEGLVEESIFFARKALSANPNHTDALYVLAKAYMEMGDASSCLRVIRRLAKLTDSVALKRELLSMLKLLGVENLAPSILGTARVSEIDHRRFFPADPGEGLLSEVLELFTGRSCHAEKVNYVACSKGIAIKGNPITPEKLKRHILGETYLFFFPVNEDNKVKLCIFNVRPSMRGLAGEIELKNASLWFQKQLRLWGIECYVERLSSHHYRIWIFLTEPVHFLWMHRFSRKIVERIPFIGGGVLIVPEEFSEGAGVGWFEKPIPLPLGVESLTLERSLFLSPDGEPYPNQLEFLRKVVPVSPDALKRFCVFDVSVEEVPYPSKVVKLRRECSLIDYIMKRAEAGKRLSREEKVALILTVGFLEQGEETIHRILSQCPDYSFSKVKRLLDNAPPRPISCAKLEMWFGRKFETSMCLCSFGEVARERYPSPLLHVAPELVPTSEELIDMMPLKELAANYMKLKERLLWMERVLAKGMLKEGIETLKTKKYILNLVDDGIEMKLR